MWEKEVGGDYARVFRFENNGRSITITGYMGALKYVFIPSAINNVPVTSIESNAFRGNVLTGVIIPNSVTSIGFATFTSLLTRVTIGRNVRLDRDSFFVFFDTYYNDNGKKAGTYTYANRKWSGPK
jgi:hypothetical protein